MKKTVIIIACVIAIVFLVRFVITVTRLVKMFESGNDIEKTGQVTGSRFFIACNLHTGKNDTIYLKGKKLFNYWMYYCAPCFREMPDLIKLNSSHGNVILLTTDSSAQTIEALRKIDGSLPVYYYSDTTVFGSRDIFPRTIIMQDTLIKRDLYGEIGIRYKEVDSLLSSR